MPKKPKDSEVTEPKRKRLNADQRRATKAAAIQQFAKQYGRKAGRSEPNDRHYDREVEKAVRKMRPEDLDRLLREGEDDT